MEAKQKAAKSKSASPFSVVVVVVIGRHISAFFYFRAILYLPAFSLTSRHFVRTILTRKQSLSVQSLIFDDPETDLHSAAIATVPHRRPPADHDVRMKVTTYAPCPMIDDAHGDISRVRHYIEI